MEQIENVAIAGLVAGTDAAGDEDDGRGLADRVDVTLVFDSLHHQSSSGRVASVFDCARKRDASSDYSWLASTFVSASDGDCGASPARAQEFGKTGGVGEAAMDLVQGARPPLPTVAEVLTR